MAYSVTSINDEFGLSLRIFNSQNPLQIAGKVGDKYLYYYSKYGYWTIVVADHITLAIDGITGAADPNQMTYYATGEYEGDCPHESEIETIIRKALEVCNG